MKNTSLEAFNKIRAEKIDERHRVIILKAMKSRKVPATSEVISIWCRLDYYQVARRMSELEKDGKVIHTQEKTTTSNGGTARKWKLSDNELNF